VRTTKPTTHWTCGASAAAVVIIRELELRLTSNALEPRAVATRIEAGIEPDRVRQHPAAGADDAEAEALTPRCRVALVTHELSVRAWKDVAHELRRSATNGVLMRS